MINIPLTKVPENIKNDNGYRVGDKLVKLEYPNFSIIWIGHKNSRAFSIKVSNPVTLDNIINSAIKRLCPDRSNTWNDDVARKNCEDIKNLISWLIDELLKVGSFLSISEIKTLATLSAKNYNSKLKSEIVTNLGSVQISEEELARVLIQLLIKSRKNISTTLKIGELIVEGEPEKLLDSLIEVDLYHSECDHVLSKHLSNIEKLTTISEVQKYDLSLNYPKTPIINL